MRVVSADGLLRREPVLDISDHVNSYWDRGLLGIAVDPTFASNRFVYLLYTYEANAINPSGAKTSRLVRIRVGADEPGRGSVGARDGAARRVGARAVPGARERPRLHPLRRPARTRSAPCGPTPTARCGSAPGTPRAGRRRRDCAAELRRADVRRQAHPRRPRRARARRPPVLPGETDLTKVCTKLYAKGFRNPFRFQLRAGGGPLVGDVGLGELRGAQPDAARPQLRLAVLRRRRPDAGLQGPRGVRGAVRPGARAARPLLPAVGERGDRRRTALRRRGVPGRLPRPVVLRRLREGAALDRWRWTRTAGSPASSRSPRGSSRAVDLERAPNGDLVFASFGAAPCDARSVHGNRAPVRARMPPRQTASRRSPSSSARRARWTRTARR